MNKNKHQTTQAGKLQGVAPFKQVLVDVPSLEKLGFKVQVQVCRIRECAGRELRSRKPNRDRMASKAIPLFMLRAEREQQVAGSLGYGDFEAACKIPHVKAMIDKRMHENYLSPFGGYTNITVTTPAGKRYTGTSYCHIHDIFNRRVANTLAFNEVFNAMIVDSVKQPVVPVK